ncbi:MAG: ribonuclease III [Anaerolineaceae bacterium]|nr:ribonuclease III [Anaerolineaceae bacterium]
MSGNRNKDGVQLKRENPREFANRIGLEFNDWLLLSRALTHRSYLNEHSDALEDNERLEFLGDAVLDFIAAAWLYNRYPEMPEGDLTRMRSALVHTEQLANFARKIGLGRAMLLGRGEMYSGGAERFPLLCDTFEALVGAIYLDSGDIGMVKNFIIPFFDAAADDAVRNRKNEDPKGLLQEWVQSQGYSAPKYVIQKAYGPDHSKVFEVDVLVNGKPMASGTGHSKQAATKDAALHALKKHGLVD